LDTPVSSCEGPCARSGNLARRYIAQHYAIAFLSNVVFAVVAYACITYQFRVHLSLWKEGTAVPTAWAIFVSKCVDIILEGPSLFSAQLLYVTIVSIFARHDLTTTWVSALYPEDRTEAIRTIDSSSQSKD
jgi:hypothetical protein